MVETGFPGEHSGMNTEGKGGGQPWRVTVLVFCSGKDTDLWEIKRGLMQDSLGPES